MGSFKLSFVVSLAMVVATSMQFHGTAAQTTHVIGGPFGWTVPPNGPLAYTFWASFQPFKVGDTLVFNFATGRHNVAEVSPAAYGLCNTANPIFLETTGPAIVKLTSPGQHYYICTVATHCQLGQKLAINVAPA